MWILNAEAPLPEREDWGKGTEWIWISHAPFFPSPMGLMAKPQEAGIHVLGMGLTVLARQALTPA